MVLSISWFMKGLIALIMFITYEHKRLGSEKLFVVSPSTMLLIALGPISFYLLIFTMIGDYYYGG